MLDALEAASVEIVADCRRGERRLRDIIDLEGRLDHRDVFLSERGAVKDEKFAPAYRARPVESSPMSAGAPIPGGEKEYVRDYP